MPAGSLALHYKIADAYGVASAEATFDSPGAPAKHRLVEPPRVRAVAAERGGRHRRSAARPADLSEHPWAGAESTMTLSAPPTSPASVGESEPIKLKLPQRAFVNPLAKALVEQRRALILDPDAHRATGSRMRSTR